MADLVVADLVIILAELVLQVKDLPEPLAELTSVVVVVVAEQGPKVFGVKAVAVAA